MGKRRKPKRKRRRKPSRSESAVEDRRGEVVTVAWMLTMVATLGAELVGAGLRVLVGLMDNPPPTWLALPGLMLFTATVTGLICLALTPLVYRFRRVPPPTAVTALAVTVSVLPLAIGVMMSLA